MNYKKNCKNLIFLSTILLVGFFSVSVFQAKKNPNQQLRQAVAQFYVALNQMFTGDLTAMEDVWSHDSDVVYMGPDSCFQVGWNNVLADFQKQAAMKMGGEIYSENMQIVVGEDLAVIQNYEKGRNSNINGRNQDVSIRVTNVFRLEKGEWKMIAHHTDPLVQMQE